MSYSFPAWFPDWAQAVADWLMQPIVLAVLGSTSVLLFVLSLVGLPLIVNRLPTDFFSRPERRRRTSFERDRPFWFVLCRSLKNVLGCALLLLGVLMLFAPGQGLLTVFVALLLIDYPGKRRLQRWIVSRPAVHRPLNALRRRAGRPPLDVPLRG